MADNAELIDRIRNDVAKQHDLLLGRNDPILAMVTVNEHLLEHYCNLIQSRADASNEKAITAASAIVEAAKDSAGKLITNSASYIRAQVEEAVAHARRQGEHLGNRHVDDAREFKQDAQVARRGALWAAAVAGFAAAVAIGVAIGLLVAR